MHGYVIIMRRLVAVLVLLAVIGTATAITLPIPKKLSVNAYPRISNVGQEVTIVVSTSLTHNPVEGAQVYIKKGLLGEWVLIGYTNSNGEIMYTFNESGYYEIKAEKSGYISDTLHSFYVKPLGRLKVYAKVTGWECPYNIYSGMTVGEAIEKYGDFVNVLIKVTDNEGNPISNAEVNIHPLPNNYINPIGYTDENGELNVTLPPGAYVITAKKENYISGVGFSLTITEDMVKEMVRNKIEEAKEKVGEAKQKVEEKLKILKVENKKFVNANAPEPLEIKVTFEGEPVADATVKITKMGVVVKEGKTDYSGIYVYTGPFDKGVYVITASKEGYRDGKSVFVVEKVPTFVHIMPVIEPEKPGVVEFGKAFINEIELKVKEKVQDVIVTIKELKKLPKKVPKPPGSVYVCMEINVSVVPSNVEWGAIKFNVSKSWLVENNIDKSTVVLMRYVDGQWIPLDTKIVGEDNKYVYYIAKTPGFSIYAITGGGASSTTTPTPMTTAIPTPTETPTPMATPIQTPAKTPTPIQNSIASQITTLKKTPGFEVVVGILGCALALALRKRF